MTPIAHLRVKHIRLKSFRLKSLRVKHIAALALLGLAAGAAAIGDGEAAHQPLEPLDVHAKASVNVVEQLSRHHYVHKEVDDSLSSEVFDQYLDSLDGSRSHFLQQDVERFEQYRYTLDDALSAGNLDPAFEIFNRYQQRMVERLEFSIALLEEGIDTFDFTLEETLSLDREDAPWLEGRAAQHDLWRRQVKADVLSMKLNDKPDEEIQEVLLKRYRNRLHRAGQSKPEDAFQLYMNAVGAVYDPHTQYFSPRTSENFDINMSLSLEGIGAVLRSEDTYTTVVRLVPAGPAEKSGELHPSDRIVGVGQGEEGEITDVVGWRLDDVVDLIRGKAGTVVRLEVVRGSQSTATAEPEVIELTRESVKLEEQSAQSRVLDIQREGETHRIGVIDIPTFYIDFKAMQQGEENYKSTTRDVRRLIEELKEENIEGLVLDLRNNGGGSLQEANAMTGLFVPQGPTVQVRSANNRVDILDSDAGVAWDGPLAVLVNRLSASASEIFAGAIQDYQRGIVVGTQTFGKGTVQTLVPLNRGQLKMTQAKFYRVSGQSTQHQGIIPDIEYPKVYNPEKIGESALEGALPWDVIRPARFRRAESLAPVITMLEDRHRQRAREDAEFSYLASLLEHTRAREEKKRISLNLAERRAEQSDEDAWRLALENKRRIARGEEPVDSLDALDEDATDPKVAASGREDGLGVPAEASETDESGGGPAEDQRDKHEDAGRDDSASEPGAGDSGAGEDGAEATVAANDTDEAADDPDALLEESGEILLDYVTVRRNIADLDGAETGADELTN